MILSWFQGRRLDRLEPFWCVEPNRFPRVLELERDRDLEFELERLELPEFPILNLAWILETLDERELALSLLGTEREGLFLGEH